MVASISTPEGSVFFMFGSAKSDGKPVLAIPISSTSPARLRRASTSAPARHYAPAFCFAPMVADVAVAPIFCAAQRLAGSDTAGGRADAAGRRGCAGYSIWPVEVGTYLKDAAAGVWFIPCPEIKWLASRRPPSPARRSKRRDAERPRRRQSGPGKETVQQPTPQR